MELLDWLVLERLVGVESVGAEGVILNLGRHAGSTQWSSITVARSADLSPNKTTASAMLTDLVEVNDFAKHRHTEYPLGSPSLDSSRFLLATADPRPWGKELLRPQYLANDSGFRAHTTKSVVPNLEHLLLESDAFAKAGSHRFIQLNVKFAGRLPFAPLDSGDPFHERVLLSFLG